MMPVALDKFVKQLEDSGLISLDLLRGLLPPQAAPQDAQELARELVRQKLLTKYQAQEVYQGNGKRLVFGNYAVLDRIGAGGMGQVFKAEHRRMKRVVAIKTLPANMLKNTAAAARFQREVEAAAKLSHPNIVAAYDADEAGGVHFLVMEFVEGSDLAALVKKHGPRPIPQAVNYILQAAQGLKFAHEQGVVHRDIKPANLLVDAKGNLKILDMGLARIDAGDGPAQAELTGTGAVLGTVDYMAPEQALSTRQADARADIYSLGCTLFYLLAGRPPFDGETLTARLLAHQSQPVPSLRAARMDVPEAVESVFNRMVAKTREDRYQSMDEAIADLKRIEHDPALIASSTHSAAQLAHTWAASNPPEYGSLTLAPGETFKSASSSPVSETSSPVNTTPAKRPSKSFPMGPLVVAGGAVAIVILAGLALGAAALSGLFKGSGKQEPPVSQASAIQKSPVDNSGGVKIPAETSPPAAPILVAPAQPIANSLDLGPLGRPISKWILSSGGSLGIMLDNQAREVRALDMLPTMPDLRQAIMARQPPRELHFLDDRIGEWDVESTILPCLTSPQGGRISAMETTDWILDGWFQRSRRFTSDIATPDAVLLLSYDAAERAFRGWKLERDGEVTELAGEWDEAKRNLTWRTTSELAHRPKMSFWIPSRDRQSYSLDDLNDKGQLMLSVRSQLQRRTAAERN